MSSVYDSHIPRDGNETTIVLTVLPGNVANYLSKMVACWTTKGLMKKIRFVAKCFYSLGAEYDTTPEQVFLIYCLKTGQRFSVHVLGPHFYSQYSDFTWVS